MVQVLVRDKDGLSLPSLNTTKAMNDEIAAVVAAKPGRLNPWYPVILTILGIRRPTYVKVVNGTVTEIQYLS